MMIGYNMTTSKFQDYNELNPQERDHHVFTIAKICSRSQNKPIYMKSVPTVRPLQEISIGNSVVKIPAHTEKKKELPRNEETIATQETVQKK